MNQEEFRKLQQYCGFNLSPRGTLMSETLAIKPASCVMYDWMHTYVSNGIWNLEIQLLAQTLHDAGVSLDMLHSDLQGFCWPSFIKSHGMSGQNLFEHCQLQDIKCSASEALSVYGVIRWILVERRLRGELDRAELAVNSYLRLCRCLDLLINIKKRKPKHHNFAKLFHVIWKLLNPHMVFHVGYQNIIIPPTLHTCTVFTKYYQHASCWRGSIKQ